MTAPTRVLAIALLCCGFARAQATGESADEVEARVLYETAVRLKAEGRADQAREALRRLVTRFPQSRYAEAARGKLVELEQPVPDLSLAPRLRAPNNPDPVETGRWELIIGQTVFGGYYGLALTNMFDGIDEDVVLWGTIGAALASLGTSALATRDFPLHDGYTHLYLNFQTYAVMDALLLFASAEVDDEDVYLGGSVAAGLVGMGAALALGERLDVPRGQAELITGAGAFGLWTGLALSVIATDEPEHAAEITVPVLVAGNVGLALGAYAAPRLRWGKWRVRLVELGLLLGGGLGLAAAVSGDVDSARSGFATLYGSSLAGGLIAVLATSGFNTGSADRGGGPRAALVPTALPTADGHSVPGFVLAGHFW